MLISFFNAVLIVAITVLSYKYFSLREKTGPFENRYGSLIEGVSSIIDRVEGYETDHAQQVALISLRIGEQINLSPSSLQILCASAMLHDAGEILLPKEILKSKDILSPEEVEILHTHTLLGELHLKKGFEHSDEVASIVRWHHERWDGMGYPDNLMGEEIPLCARILNIADSISAMASFRPHKKSTVMNQEKVIEELLLGSGSQFDPNLVAAFLKLDEAMRQEIFALSGSGKVEDAK